MLQRINRSSLYPATPLKLGVTSTGLVRRVDRHARQKGRNMIVPKIDAITGEHNNTQYQIEAKPLSQLSIAQTLKKRMVKSAFNKSAAER